MALARISHHEWDGGVWRDVLGKKGGGVSEEGGAGVKTVVLARGQGFLGGLAEWMAEGARTGVPLGPVGRLWKISLDHALPRRGAARNGA